MVPPKSLHEIFQISNNNRKRNKMRKKSKLESCQSGSPNGHYASASWNGYGPSDPSNQYSDASMYGAAPPPSNVHQII